MSGAKSVPWVPTRDDLIPYVMMLAKVGEGDVFYELGCGDGKVAVEAAKRGARAVCIEISGSLIKKAEERARREGVLDRVVLINDDFFNVPLNDATTVYMYLLTHVNRELEPKLSSELRPGTRVVTLDFRIPDWCPVHVIRIREGLREYSMYLYIVGVSDKCALSH